MEFIARIPRWKAYLYTLLQRYRLFRWLNAGWIRLNLSRGEIVLLRNMLTKYVPKGVMRRTRTVRYERLIKEVLIRNVTIAGREEIELAMKLTWVQHIKSEELIMEIAQLKNFGKEVGLKPLQMAKMGEEELIKTILKSLDPQNTYSQEFVAWYDSVPDDVFDATETIDVANGSDTAAETDGEALLTQLGTSMTEMVDTINGITTIKELQDIVNDEDFAILFDSIKTNKHKSAKALKEAMINALQNPGANGDNVDESNADASSVAESLGIDEDTLAEMIDIITGIENEEQLLEFASDETVEAVFVDKLDIGESIDVESVKAQMLLILGVEAEEPPQEERPLSLRERMAAKQAAKQAATPKTTGKKAATSDEGYVVPFDPNAFDPNEVYAGAEALPIPKLRKFVKQLELSAGPGSNKATLLEMVANRLNEMAEGGSGVAASTGEEEVTVTKSMVNDAVSAGDKESLMAFCEHLGIALNALQKKSATLMGNKLLEVVPDDQPVNRNIAPGGRAKLTSKLKAKDNKAPAAETKSIYQLIEEMVIAGSTEKDITDAVKPYFTEKGKTLLYIKKRVKQMMEIITQDNA